ncbi:hypothetical protein FR483_n048L [Paramecium bursaria Chlorella virus FR483]|uniref:Uncharacterized protein n048L n=1 Tax=Paramecium bursaria Chlorella virus FR483 TaxID=399781 RepID=A7J6A2_PBCVF|nr:hypothetical protein FR483_n048L [Paramecium bursaria Chlorella virus FR483]ABT15333.1 hypothetical protein FR483_n048L [Paramecium bursaria Chlorella virus FR483]
MSVFALRTLVVIPPETITFAATYCPITFPMTLMFADVRLPGAAMFAPPIVFTSTFDNNNTLPVRPMTLVTGKFAPVNCNQLDVVDAGVPSNMYVTLASVWKTMLPGRAFESANLAVMFATVPLGTIV